MDWKFIMKAVFVIVVICLILGLEAKADTTSSGASDLNQTNTSGTNTSISGGYSQESTTNYQSGSSNTTNNETNTTNSTNTKTAVNSANAPALSSYGQDQCLIPITGSTSTISLGVSIGTYVEDKGCSVRKTAKLLKQMGLSIASIALLCEEMPMVKNALRISGTPCPVLHNGKSYIGEEAIKILNMKDKNKTKVDSKPSMTWNKND